MCSSDLPTGTPDGMVVVDTPSQLLALDGFNTNPDGGSDPWLSVDATNASGNNVWAYADRAGNNRAGIEPMAIDGDFDLSYRFDAEPTTDDIQAEASAVQAFYVTNYLHDWYYDAGFDEAHGNAQAKIGRAHV